jgi:hypothetical protein
MFMTKLRGCFISAQDEARNYLSLKAKTKTVPCDDSMVAEDGGQS